MNRKQLIDSEASGALMRHEAAYSAQPSDAEEPAPNVFAGVWRHRWAVLAITIFCVIGAVIYLRVIPPSYSVTSQIYIEAPANLPQLTGVSGPVDTSGDGYLWTQVAVMQSPAVCGAAAKLLMPNANEEELHQLTNDLRNNLSPDVGRRDNVISLAYTDKSPDDAATDVNAITKAYIDYSTKTHGDSSREMMNALDAEKTDYEVQLHKERDAEADFQKAHPELRYMTGPNGSNIIGTQLAKLYDNLTTDEMALANSTAELDAANSVKDDLPKLAQQASSQNYAGSAATNAEMNNDAKILSDAEARLATYKGELGQDNPLYRRDAALVVEIRAKLQELEQRYGQEYITFLEGQKLHGQEQVKAMKAEIDASEKDSDATAANSDAADYSKLENEVAATEKLVEELDQTVKGLNVAAIISQIPRITILAPGRGEDSVRTPPPGVVLALTLAAGLACGAGFALIREKLDHRVRSAEEIAGLLGLPVIGIVPHMKRGLTPLARAQAVHWDPMSEVSEAYRAVRTAVHFGVPAGQARTIVVTSPTPGDGKSTLASNLAISMAQAGKHTLLLDADFRRPVQHKMFELKDESGLTAVLAGHEPLSKAVRRTVVEGLDLLPAGPLPLNPSELLNGESFASILEELSQKYDHIVIDCPPVIAVTDARILGAVCDLSLLVLRAGKTTRQGAELARSGLLSVGSRLLGVIVNDVPRGEEQYGYYGSYVYQSGNGNRARIGDENGSSTNGHSSARRRRLPSPSGIDSM
jgi:capsular exopolysaccharide synthesis family protein